MESQKPIDIVLTAWHREWMTKLCIQALGKNTKTPYRLIVVDNGSEIEFQETWLMGSSDIYVKLDHNYGLEAAKNIGMQFVESKLFVSLDNDILVYKYPDKDWLSQLIDLMAKYPQYGAIAPRPQILVGTGNIFEGVKDEIVSFGHVPGYARIMRTDLVKAVGAWNDKRPLRGHEEYWIGEKLAENGWAMGWANNVQVWHLFGNEKSDPWGYEKGIEPEFHGHTPISSLPSNDADLILEKTGVAIYE